MTPAEALALGQRAVECPRWRWMPGMLILGRWRVDIDPERPNRGPGWECGPNGETWWEEPDADDIPDVRDPATLGCLLALVREAWVDPTAHVVPTADDSGTETWVAWVFPPAEVPRTFPGGSEAEALLAALEAAP